MRHREHTGIVRAVMTAVLLLGTTGCGRGPGPVEIATVSFPSNGHTLAADLYAPRRPNGVGIVFLHGSSPAGRNLHLYPALCRALADRGYTLLNVDVRGYGDSENPRRPDRLEDYDFVGDAVEAAAFARTLVPDGDAWTWIMIGHSKGGGVAVRAGLDSGHIHGIISISPGRRIVSRFFDSPRRSDIEYLQQRKSRDMRLPEPIPMELLEPILTSYDIEQWRGSTLDKPLLLIEGGREPAADLAFSLEWIDSLSGPVSHRVIENADHYFGTAIVESGGVRQWRTVDDEVLRALLDIMDDWIQANVQPRNPHD